MCLRSTIELERMAVVGYADRLGSPCAVNAAREDTEY